MSSTPENAPDTSSTGRTLHLMTEKRVRRKGGRRKKHSSSRTSTSASPSPTSTQLQALLALLLVLVLCVIAEVVVVDSLFLSTEGKGAVSSVNAVANGIGGTREQDKKEIARSLRGASKQNSNNDRVHDEAHNNVTGGVRHLQELVANMTRPARE